MLTTLLSSFMLGDINLQGVSSQGDTNVMSVIQTVFIWVLLFAIIGSLVVKSIVVRLWFLFSVELLVYLSMDQVTLFR
ncbi:hypothetical protein F6Y02_40880 (plasmid) [Bacillus megaterium]|nr:hypothetical protein [Priestia megaterium]